MKQEQTTKTEWFSHWFDSPYYHVLYRHRDDIEARNFLDRLLSRLEIHQDAKILDLACGKGRHAIYLNQKNYDVTGIDLSANSISQASIFENKKLRFHVHDMRHVFKPSYFDLVLNMFTSFGYFDSKAENKSAIQSITANLKSQGQMILDFMNTDRIIAGLIPNEHKYVDRIDFYIKRYVENGYIVKEINFKDGGMDHKYLEKVMALTESDFLAFFDSAGCQVKDIFGSYQLEPYSLKQSERMIFWVKKQ